MQAQGMESWPQENMQSPEDKVPIMQGIICGNWGFLWEDTAWEDAATSIWGIRLNHRLDCQRAEDTLSLLINKDSKKKDGLYSLIEKMDCEQFSVDSFYMNLGRISKREWWIWDSDETGSLTAYLTELGNRNDRGYFLMLAASLFIDTDSEAYSNWI